MVTDALVKGRVEKVLRFVEGSVPEYEIRLRRPVYAGKSEGFAIAVLVAGSRDEQDLMIYGMKFSGEGRLDSYEVYHFSDFGNRFDQVTGSERTSEELVRYALGSSWNSCGTLFKASPGFFQPEASFLRYSNTSLLQCPETKANWIPLEERLRIFY